MKALLTTSESQRIRAKVDKLEAKGYSEFSFTVDRTSEGKYNVEILGKHNLEELDRLMAHEKYLGNI